MADPDFSSLRAIHKLMGIKAPFEDKLKHPDGVQLEDDGSNIALRGGAIYIIDPETGEEYQATIHIKNQTHLKGIDDFKAIFSSDFLSNWRSDSRRIHLTKCSTIQRMIERDEFFKYHASHRDDYERRVKARSGEFDVELKVCWNCIKELNLFRIMKGVDARPTKFDFLAFFKLNIGKTPEAEQSELDPADAYPSDWDSKISPEYKASVHWTCECCSVNLSGKRKLLDTHHIDKRKANCHPDNLRALCKNCHAEQPHHEHMRADMPYLRKLRREQNLPDPCRECWN